MNGTDRRTFVIADIHGCYSTFCALLDQITLTREDELYLLGDYIDRDSESKEVVECWEWAITAIRIAAIRIT